MRRESNQASSSSQLESSFDALLQRVKKKTASDGGQRRTPLHKTTKEQLNDALLAFQRSGWAADQAIAIYVNAQLFP